MLVSGDPMGIVTDADLRARVLAEGLGPDVPVTRVMSAPLKTFPAESPLVEALLYVLGERIHHLALERSRRQGTDHHALDSVGPPPLELAEDDRTRPDRARHHREEVDGGDRSGRSGESFLAARPAIPVREPETQRDE